MTLPQTPGRACAPGGTFSQRSGLDGMLDQTLAQRCDNVGALEFLGVFPPNTFVSIQGKNRNKYAISLGDPDRTQSVTDKISKGYIVGVPDPGAVREWNNIILHGNPRGGWDRRV